MRAREVWSVWRQVRLIDGWLTLEAVYLFALIDEVQSRLQIRGNLFEIGVHHGKSTIVLSSLVRGGESIGVCDLFDLQSLNATHSGRGNRSLFTNNFTRTFPNDSFLRVYEKPSSELTEEEVTTNCRLFHIDGGHSASETYVDLDTATKGLLPLGAVVVDDAFNEGWPGVSEGVMRYLSENSDSLAPLCIAFNKLVLVRPEAHQSYYNFLCDREFARNYIASPPYKRRLQEVCGVQTVIWQLPAACRRMSLKASFSRMMFRIRNRQKNDVNSTDSP